MKIIMTDDVMDVSPGVMLFTKDRLAEILEFARSGAVSPVTNPSTLASPLWAEVKMQFVVQFFDPKKEATVLEVKIMNHQDLLALLDLNRDPETKPRQLFTVYELGDEVLDWS